MSVASCLRPSESRWFSASILSTIASTTSPFFRISDGCFMRLLHDMSEMWIRPSMSSSTSTNAPNSVRLRTLPLMRVPTGYFSASSCQGFCSTCFRPSEMRRAVASTPRTIASTLSPTFRIFDGCFTRLLHDISLTNLVAFRHLLPRIRDELLGADRDALGRRVVPEDGDADLVVDLEHFGR